MSTTTMATSPSPLRRVSHRFHSLPGVQLVGVGSYVPEQIVSNEDLAGLGYDAQWIFQRTGIRERRHAVASQATSDLAYEAAQRALVSAGLEAADLDLILVMTCTPDSQMPATACHLQRRLGSQAAAIDMNAACAGFMYGLATGSQFVHSGHSRHVLVVGSETMSRLMNPRDRKTYPLFGDGAGAVILGRGTPAQGLLAYTLGADGEGTHLLQVPGGGSREPISDRLLTLERQFLQMEGRPVFKWAVRLLADVLRATLQEAQLAPHDVKAVVLHQANIRIIDAAIEEVGLDRQKFIVNVDRYGNTSAASIPLALDEAWRASRFQRGDAVLLCGFGAGLTWGAALLRW